MFKNIVVMSRPEAERYFHKPHEEKSVAISITNVGDANANIYRNSNNRLFDVCRVQFDDVERGGKNCITKKEAETIADFVDKYKDTSIDTLVVHCEAGQSRSAGVAAAIMKKLYDNDMPIFGNPKFTPNQTCYRETLNALFEKDLSLEKIIQDAGDKLDSLSATFDFDDKMFADIGLSTR